MRPALRRAAALGLTGLLAGAGAVASLSEVRLRQRVSVPESALDLDTAGASLERGRHLVRAVAQCGMCHGEDLGGATLADDRWLGRLDAPNLTPGDGGLAHTTDASLVRAIRHGLREDGRSLLMMPSQRYRLLPDADVASIVAYLRSRPPIDRRTRPPRVGPFTRLALALGRTPDLLAGPRAAERVATTPSPTPGPTAEYGAHLAEIAGCKLCHGDDLRGGLHPLALPGEPPPPDLTPSGAVAGWTEQEFLQTLRTGLTPDRRRLDEASMPWRAASRMTDDELAAIWRFLRSLPPGEPGKHQRI